MEAGLADLSCEINIAQSTIDKLKRKRDDVEAAIWEEEKTMKAELHEERKRSTSTRLELEEKLIIARRERNDALSALLAAHENRKDIECMEKKAHDERDAALLKAQKERKAKCRALKYVKEMTELVRMCKRDQETLEEAAAQATELAQARQRSLEQLTKDKETLELAHQGEIERANRDRQNYDRELQHLQIAKGKVEGELLTMQEDRDRLKIAHERNESILKKKQFCQLCLESPKDALCFPCLHAGYCFGCLEKHREKSRTCPTCRASLHGVLKTEICI